MPVTLETKNRAVSVMKSSDASEAEIATAFAVYHQWRPEQFAAMRLRSEVAA